MTNMSQQQKTHAVSEGAGRDFSQSMSDHVAYALLVYTALQIFVTVKEIAVGGASILPYLALVVLVAGIIPACRWFEKRWTDLSDSSVDETAMASAFRRDVFTLWALAVGLPFLFTGLFRLIFSGV